MDCLARRFNAPSAALGELGSLIGSNHGASAHNRVPGGVELDGNGWNRSFYFVTFCLLAAEAPYYVCFDHNDRFFLRAYETYRGRV